MKIEIQQGRVIDPSTQFDQVCNIYIEHGRILYLGQQLDGFVADEVIDARGMAVLPGLVDLSARLREPGFEYMATLESEMAAAVAGGITHLACPPDTDPPLDEPALVEMLKHRARLLQQAHLYPVGALTQGLKGEQITEMVELSEAGCIAFSQADHPIIDTLALLRAMQYAATFNYPVWLRPQDYWLSKDGVAHDGEMATRMGLTPIPVCAETIALNTILALVKETGCKTHLCRLSSAVAIDMVRQAKQRGLPITCDVSIHHLHLSDNDLGYFDSAYHLRPPLRTPRDRDAIWAGLLDGTIDAICSDHTPVDGDQKLLPFAESEAGATGLELLLPLVLLWVTQNHLNLFTALNKITASPARVLGIEAGRIHLGASADLCMVDLQTDWVVSQKTLKSQGRNTPYFGKPITGRVKRTFVSGSTVYQDTL